MENNATLIPAQKLDRESEHSLIQMAEQEQAVLNRIEGVKFVLVVLSAAGMVYDKEAIRQKILSSYPDSVVFFSNTMGKSIGSLSLKRVDLLIDFTGAGQRQGWFYAKKLRKLARVAVGRNAGFFRKKIYDRIFDEKAAGAQVPLEILARERFVQKKVLNLAGVAFVQAGLALPDLGKSIALELPGMQRL